MKRRLECEENMNWKLLGGFLFFILGLLLVVYNELLVHGVLGRTVTGAIFIVLGLLIILLKKEQLHYAFFIASFLILIKVIEGLRETDMKNVGFVVGDIAMFLIIVMIGFGMYFLVKKHVKIS